MLIMGERHVFPYHLEVARWDLCYFHWNLIPPPNPIVWECLNSSFHMLICNTNNPRGNQLSKWIINGDIVADTSGSWSTDGPEDPKLWMCNRNGLGTSEGCQITDESHWRGEVTHHHTLGRVVDECKSVAFDSQLSKAVECISIWVYKYMSTEMWPLFIMQILQVLYAIF